jgi:NADPH-dependent glutamate synthase beta subunit-like oxidoreductase
VRLIAWGRFEEALEIVRKVNPFPSVCGRICQHPCEDKCRRSAVDSAIALKELKRFVTEVEAASDFTPEVVPVTREKVAVVGAGPAGLTAAQDLRSAGCAVTVFERLDRPGGMLNIIPRYRLPEQVLRRDINTILARGIDLHCDREIGRDLSVSDLKTDGCKAIVVCTGLSRSRGLALPGFGAERFLAAIPLMMDVWAGKPVRVGQRALVIGGGNVAADVARTLRRLGAEEVIMACVESREEMPAAEEEIVAAVEEGIRLMPSWAPKRVLKSDQHVAGLEMMRVTSVFDEQGRFNPQYDFNHLRVVTADMIVLTIGQAGDTSWTQDSEVALDRRGRVVADRKRHTTSEPGVFLAGEANRGPGNVVEAIAEGHEVAAIVDEYLRTGRARIRMSEEPPIVADFPSEVRENVLQIERVPMRQISSSERLAGFKEHDLGYDEASALKEAARCLNCGAGPTVDEDKCAFCLTCFRLCPLDGIEIGKQMITVPEACQACGLCAAECPQGAIALEHWPGEQFRRQLAEALREAGSDGPSNAVVQCVHTAATRSDLSLRFEREGDFIIRLSVPCVTHLTPLDLMLLVGNGVERIRVAMCGLTSCKHSESQRRAIRTLSAAIERIREVRPAVKIAFVEADPVRAENRST